jgi:L-gulonate 5-dehydrogenase
MRAAVMTAPREMHVSEWPTPKPAPGEVLIAVKAAGICAGDMYIYLGKNPYAGYPQVCGHEIAGVVAEPGDGVSDLEPGTAVVVEPFLGCGSCYPCRIGKSNCCSRLQIIGVHLPGGYAEYLTAPASHVYRVPGGLTFVEASLAEPVAVAVQACRRGDVSMGEDVLVLGCGPIGLALVEVARARGANVLAADILPARLRAAARLGAEVLSADEELVPRVLERTGGEGMPVVVEATGNVRAMEQTVELVAAGGRIVIVGLVKEGLKVSLPGLDLTRKEMTIFGSRASAGCFPEALELLASGAISYGKMATEFDLWEAPRVFAALAERPDAVHKGVLVKE